MPTVRVQPGPFDVGAEIGQLAAGRTDIGGIGSFIGLVRGAAGPEAGLATLTLEHYPGMTEKALTRIAETAVARWDLLGCTIIHRIGPLPPGEPIVLVLAAAAHREAALTATAFLIDYLKTRAPFWKSEQFQDGSSGWVQARADDDASADRWDERP